MITTVPHIVVVVTRASQASYVQLLECGKHVEPPIVKTNQHPLSMLVADRQDISVNISQHITLTIHSIASVNSVVCTQSITHSPR